MGQDEVDHHLLGGTAIKPKGWDRKGMEAFKYMIYNPDTGEVFTRTPLSWLKITVFYIVYYSLLVGFWAACLQIFFLTLPEAEDGPKWTLDSSRIGVNPGVGMRPAPTDKNIDSQMLYLNKSSDNMKETNDDGEGNLNIDYAVRMRNYIKKNYDQALEPCDDNRLREKGEKACKFDFEMLGDCKDFPYGFVNPGENGFINPCIYLKFNKIYNWVPVPINKENLDDEKYKDTYADMTHEMKEIIKNADNPDYIWLDCKGRFAADKERIDMTFFPANQGIPIKYFPFQGGDYQPPLVAVRLNMNKPQSTTGQLIHVQCKAWFEGVIHNTRDKMGMVMFEVFLD